MIRGGEQLCNLAYCCPKRTPILLKGLESKGGLECEVAEAGTPSTYEELPDTNLSIHDDL